jgi:hypothetical protein
MAIRVRTGGGAILTVFDSRITEMTLPGGDIWKWTRTLTRETEELSKAMAPVRSTALVRSIGFAVTPVPGPAVLGTVRATAPHALYVLKGTGPKVLATGWMTFLGNDVVGGHIGWYRGKYFRGQRANNFMDDAKTIVLARHRAL